MTITSITSVNDIKNATVADLNKVYPLCVAFWLNATAEERTQVTSLSSKETARSSGFWDGVAAEAAEWSLRATGWNRDLTFTQLLTDMALYESLLNTPSSVTRLPLGTADVVNAIRTATLDEVKAEQDKVRNFFARIPAPVVDEVLYHTGEAKMLDFDFMALVSRLATQARKLSELGVEAANLTTEPQRKKNRRFFNR